MSLEITQLNGYFGAEVSGFDMAAGEVPGAGIGIARWAAFAQQDFAVADQDAGDDIDHGITLFQTLKPGSHSNLPPATDPANHSLHR